jgi:hypothetical protein
MQPGNARPQLKQPARALHTSRGIYAPAGSIIQALNQAIEPGLNKLDKLDDEL